MEFAVNGSRESNMAQHGWLNFVKVCDWKKHLSKLYRSMPGVKKYQHYRYTIL
jgi:hypothetical protein